MVRLRTFDPWSHQGIRVSSSWDDRRLLIEVIFCLWFCVSFRMDATLKELTSLVKEVYPEARKKGTHFSFNIVYPDPRGKVYRLVSHPGVEFKAACCAFWSSLCTKFTEASLSFQVEGYRQHCVRQEGHRWLHDPTVAAIPDRRLSGHRYHAAQQSPAPQHTHEALLSVSTHTSMCASNTHRHF